MSDFEKKFLQIPCSTNEREKNSCTAANKKENVAEQLGEKNVLRTRLLEKETC